MDNLIAKLMSMVGRRRSRFAPEDQNADPNAFDPSAIGGMAGAMPQIPTGGGVQLPQRKPMAPQTPQVPQLPTGGGVRLPQRQPMTPMPRGGMPAAEPMMPLANAENSTTAPSVADQIRQALWEQRKKDLASKANQGDSTAMRRDPNNWGGTIGQLSK